MPLTIWGAGEGHPTKRDELLVRYVGVSFFVVLGWCGTIDTAEWEMTTFFVAGPSFATFREKGLRLLFKAAGE